MKRAFKRADIPNQLQVVTDGEEAIHYLQGEGRYADRQAFPLPRLIVMDINMPRKTGFRLEWLKSDGVLRRIPVVIVSASDRPSDVNRAYELGANAYMVKPVDFRPWSICSSPSRIIGARNAPTRLGSRVARVRACGYAPTCFLMASQIFCECRSSTAASRPSSSRRAFGSVPE